jgi:hypothetical protein
MNGIRLEIVQRAFDMLGSNPAALQPVFEFVSRMHSVVPPVSTTEVFSEVASQSYSSPCTRIVHSAIAKWDYAENPPWSVNTRRSTNERRVAIYDLLGLDTALRQICEEVFPRHPTVEPATVIVNDEPWVDWYVPARRTRNFYWNSYQSHLKNSKHWDARNVVELDDSTTDVLRRLADPEAAQARQAKGLVVGYVQSGKTAHYTGVIAKAADAGYRLIIVLAGTINILRDQTQRRLDKELVGWELLNDDYEGDPEESEFVHHGALPSNIGGFNWERLTLSRRDFPDLSVGLGALEFRRIDRTRPLYHAANLHYEPARLIVLKKNKDVLDKLARALSQISARSSLNDVPALIIDDESDQASVNTARPRASESEIQARTAINKRIVDLLRILPRAQYVGYTATPFANVFVDPNDAEDLFPKDFLVSLSRPVGYMGVGDFYDEEDFSATDYRSNENAFVRMVSGDDDLANNLPRAIDAFVLAGAIKLYRERKQQTRFKHHTMLVHHSPRVTVHDDFARKIQRLFEDSGYASGGDGYVRLEALWNSDFRPIIKAQAERGSVSPRRFEDLGRDIAECCRRINAGDSSVIILNGDNRDRAPNFEGTSVWKMIVGGAKLSRGYTVEGLTISYYRRVAGAADTLMQMGRWFGFRRGYRDLVRLFIGNAEPIDARGNTLNLYEAFRAICKDEEEFRDQLRRYASLKEGDRITPRQVPPLVPSRLLKPTSTNKMFNAQLVFENYGGRWVESTVAPSDEELKASNARGLRELLLSATLERGAIEIDTGGRVISFGAITARLRNEDVLNFLKHYHWSEGNENTLQRLLEFLAGRNGNPEIDSWLLIAPQAANGETWDAAGRKFVIRRRRRANNNRYGVFSEPAHRDAAAYLTDSAPGAALNAFTTKHRKPRQGVMVFYPVKSAQEEEAGLIPTVGFGLAIPPNHIPKKLLYTVRDPDQEDAVVIEQ